MPLGFALRGSAMFLFLAVAGCSPYSPETLLLDYQNRLARTLDTKGSATSLPQSSWTKPRPEQLQIALADLSVDGLDFLSLSGCALQITVGKRNSSLGKLAPPSQRLLLELEFLRLAPDCIAQLQVESGNEALISALEEATALKRRQLPARIFNALLAGPEWHAFWQVQSISEDYPSGNTSSDLLTTIEALNVSVQRWLNGNYEADGMLFEARLNQLRAGDGGTLITAAELTQRYFLDWRNLMHSSPYWQEPCDRFYTDKQTILRTVASRYFAGGVQAWLAPIASRSNSIELAVGELETTLKDVMPEDYKVWLKQRDVLLGGFKTHPRQHVEDLQRLLQPCD
jgi:hypothetical protein